METGDEMCVGFLAVSADRPGPIFHEMGLEFPELRGLGGLRLPGLGI